MNLIGKLILGLVCTLPCWTAAQSNAESVQEKKYTDAELRTAEKDLERRIEEQGRLTRIRKTFISPSTNTFGYAAYYKDVARKVEEYGMQHFPVLNEKKLYGKLIVYLPISKDGRIFEEDGGLRIEKSSGLAELDAAAIAIVRGAAPYPPIPPKMRTPGADDVWIIITSFNFINGAEKRLDNPALQ